MLKHEVSEFREHLYDVQDQAESYVEAVKVSALDKAKALLANQMAGYQQAAREHDAAAKVIARPKMLRLELYLLERLNL